jgi:hypothetical protein
VGISSGRGKLEGERDSAQRVASPDPTHTTLIEDFLVADDKQLFTLSLRNQHTVKWTG